MKNVAIIRCEKNETRCPLTGCLKNLAAGTEGFTAHNGEECRLMGVFTCRCPGTATSDLAKILKAKGVDTVHLPTCTFSAKKDGAWTYGNGFCDAHESLVTAIHDAGLNCVLGTAHLPADYTPRVLSPASSS